MPATYEDAATSLRGGTVLFEDVSFLAAIVGDLAFAALRSTGDSFGSDKAIAALAAALRRKPELLSRLAGRRGLIPANAPGCDGRGCSAARTRSRSVGMDSSAATTTFSGTWPRRRGWPPW